MQIGSLEIFYKHNTKHGRIMDSIHVKNINFNNLMVQDYIPKLSIVVRFDFHEMNYTSEQDCEDLIQFIERNPKYVNNLFMIRFPSDDDQSKLYIARFKKYLVDHNIKSHTNGSAFCLTYTRCTHFNIHSEIYDNGAWHVLVPDEGRHWREYVGWSPFNNNNQNFV
jgi:hypothetical protein